MILEAKFQYQRGLAVSIDLAEPEDLMEHENKILFQRSERVFEENFSPLLKLPVRTCFLMETVLSNDDVFLVETVSRLWGFQCAGISVCFSMEVLIFTEISGQNVFPSGNCSFQR